MTSWALSAIKLADISIVAQQEYEDDGTVHSAVTVSLAANAAIQAAEAARNELEIRSNPSTAATPIINDMPNRNEVYDIAVYSRKLKQINFLKWSCGNGMEDCENDLRHLNIFLRIAETDRLITCNTTYAACQASVLATSCFAGKHFFGQCTFWWWRRTV